MINLVNYRLLKSGKGILEFNPDHLEGALMVYGESAVEMYFKELVNAYQSATNDFSGNIARDILNDIDELRTDF